MKDRYGREIDYLRISVTDRCNLRCRYCIPEEGGFLKESELLRPDEILRLVRIMADLGIRHVRLTGGEPLLREDITEISALITGTEKIETLDLTTNGLFLADKAAGLRLAGVRGVNVSLDTTDEERYRIITCAPENERGSVRRVLNGIDAALDSGLTVRINTVLTTINRDDFEGLILLAKERPVDVRFIELMPVGYPAGAGQRALRVPGYVSGKWLFEELAGRYPGITRNVEKKGNGPAVYYRIKEFAGCIGFISAICDRFCENCNRIRITASGILKPCLCYESDVNLIELMRQGAGDNELKEIIEKTISDKPAAHSFESPDKVTERMSMSKIGG